MKNVMYGLLAALLFASAQATTVSSRTYMRPRAVRSELIGAYNLGEIAADKRRNNEWGLSVGVTGFYSRSHHATEFAKYFGGGTSAENGKIEVAVNDISGSTTALFGRDIMNAWEYQSGAIPGAPVAASAPAGGTLNFDPKRESYGANFSLMLDLDKFVNGLFVSVEAPVEHVEHDLGVTITNATAAGANLGDFAGKNIIDYFTGNLSSTTRKQDALAYAKIKNAKMTKTEVADVTASLGYQFFRNKDSKLAASIDFVIPTSEKADATYLFSPTTGYAGHFAFGGQAHFVHNAFTWKKQELDVRLGLDADYKYVLKGTQLRTMGVWDADNNRLRPVSQYRLMMQDGVGKVMPAANVLTRTAEVTPGSQFDGVVNVDVAWKGFVFGLGYNVTAAQSDKITFANPWQSDTYAFAHPNYNPASHLTNQPTTKAAIDADANAARLAARSNGLETKNRIGGTTLVALGDDLLQVHDVDQLKLDNAGKVNTANTLDTTAGAVSYRGPVQSQTVITSTLKQRVSAYTDGAALHDTFATNTAGADNQTVHYYTTDLACMAPFQISHRLLGHVDYTFTKLKFPVGFGLGGAYTFAVDNNVVPTWNIWAKFNVAF